ncbi:MAG TPA: lysylphosphatidylglycerol synthase transmembrane domain-containing protein [bacterium]|nr:lysylphosphatidylglycerol synthase transmembrane domain-containing protein [bacterium]HPP29877.1 lysylphosphatidylglycerol synthase transmembrane domain-containing protein [bacterium]
MKKNSLKQLLKVSISIFFLYLVFRKIDLSLLYTTLKGCYIPLAVLSLLIAVLLSFPLAFRWYLFLKGQVKADKIRYINIWKLNMVGMLFNNFLPTGAGGDIAKVFYLVRGEENKLLLGSSVLIDRFIGALTVITMGVVAGLLTPDIPVKVKYFLLFLIFFLLFIFIFFSYRAFASFFYLKVKRFIPDRLKETLENTYSAFNRYFSARKWLLYAAFVSFSLQAISILNNYLMALSILWNQSGSVSISMFFIYIPLIWTATLVPSLGGLGIREFTYMYFFSSSMGKENAFALSIIFLVSVIIQSVIGAVIILFLKER